MPIFWSTGKESESTLSTQCWFTELAISTVDFLHYFFLKISKTNFVIQHSKVVIFCPHVTADCSALKKLYYIIRRNKRHPFPADTNDHLPDFRHLKPSLGTLELTWKLRRCHTHNMLQSLCTLTRSQLHLKLLLIECYYITNNICSRL